MADEAKPGLEVVVGTAWSVMPAMPGWVDIGFQHPRHGWMHFLIQEVAATNMREALSSALNRQTTEKPEGPYH